MADANERSSRVEKVASVLRPLGRGPLSREQMKPGREVACH
jgi:putative transposase